MKPTFSNVLIFAMMAGLLASSITWLFSSDPFSEFAMMRSTNAPQSLQPVLVAPGAETDCPLIPILTCNDTSIEAYWASFNVACTIDDDDLPQKHRYLVFLSGCRCVYHSVCVSHRRGDSETVDSIIPGFGLANGNHSDVNASASSVSEHLDRRLEDVPSCKHLNNHNRDIGFDDSQAPSTAGREQIASDQETAKAAVSVASPFIPQPNFTITATYKAWITRQESSVPKGTSTSPPPLDLSTESHVSREVRTITTSRSTTTYTIATPTSTLFADVSTEVINTLRVASTKTVTSEMVTPTLDADLWTESIHCTIIDPRGDLHCSEAPTSSGTSQSTSSVTAGAMGSSKHSPTLMTLELIVLLLLR